MNNQSIFLKNPLLRRIGEGRFNLSRYLAERKKPPYAPCHDKIILDITYACNLKCLKCNRSCRYAPTEDMMTPAQIDHFLKESVEHERKWRQIWIEGGEPTLNPHLDTIVEMLLAYRAKYQPRLDIQLNSNGYGKLTRSKLAAIGKRVKIFSSEKTSPDVHDFCAVNLAPCDFAACQNVDYAIGCYFPSFYGFCLNMNGYYHCSTAAGIDRVLGLDIGRKRLPESKDAWWKESMAALCKYCGHFQANNREYLSVTCPEVDYIISDSWRRMFERFNTQQILLTRY